MASLTRKFLKGMGLSEEQVDAIIDTHSEVVNDLKEQIDTYKADAEALKDVQKELDDAKEQLSSKKQDAYKVKYEALKEDFDNYKAEQEKKATHEAKETAYRGLLETAGISEKRINAVLRVSDVDAVELDGDGNIKESDKLLKDIKDEWADFIVTTETHGADTPNPPDHKEGAKEAYDKMSLAERMQYANEHPAEVAEWNKQKG